MTRDQIEYCGSCNNYEKCAKLAAQGRLTSCKPSKKGKN